MTPSTTTSTTTNAAGTATTAATATADTTSTAQSEEHALLLVKRLQAQFGDLDLSHVGGLVLPMIKQQQHEVEDDDDSILEEPSPEALQAWQEAQFQKGKCQQQVKERLAMTPLERRHYDTMDDDEEWEQVEASPNLQGVTSSLRRLNCYYGCSSTSNNNNNNMVMIGVPPMLHQIARHSDILRTAWQRLYTSHQYGLSLNNVWAQVDAYPGPTLWLWTAIPSAQHCLLNKKQQNKDCLMGFYTTQPWTASTSTSDSDASSKKEYDVCLVTVDPDTDHVTLVHPKKKSSSRGSRSNPSSPLISYHNSLLASSHPPTNKKHQDPQQSRTHSTSTSTSCSSTSSSHLEIGQGRIQLTETLEDCRALPSDAMLESCPLLPSFGDDSLYYFDVTELEVWAVGGTDWIAKSLAEQSKTQSLQDAARRRHQCLSTQSKVSMVQELRMSKTSTT